jgi:hypothetical protein
MHNSRYTYIRAVVIAFGPTLSLSHKISNEEEYNKLALRCSSALTKWQLRDDQAQVEYNYVRYLKVTYLLRVSRLSTGFLLFYSCRSHLEHRESVNASSHFSFLI